MRNGRAPTCKDVAQLNPSAPSFIASATNCFIAAFRPGWLGANSDRLRSPSAGPSNLREMDRGMSSGFQARKVLGEPSPAGDDTEPMERRLAVAQASFPDDASANERD